MTKVETGLRGVDLLTRQKWRQNRHNKSGDLIARGGSTDMTKVETGLRELDLLTRQKWRQDCEWWICCHDKSGDRAVRVDTTKVETGLQEVQTGLDMLT